MKTCLIDRMGCLKAIEKVAHPKKDQLHFVNVCILFTFHLVLVA